MHIRHVCPCSPPFWIGLSLLPFCFYYQLSRCAYRSEHCNTPYPHPPWSLDTLPLFPPTIRQPAPPPSLLFLHTITALRFFCSCHPCFPLSSSFSPPSNHHPLFHLLQFPSIFFRRFSSRSSRYFFRLLETLLSSPFFLSPHHTVLPFRSSRFFDPLFGSVRPSSSHRRITHSS